MNHLALIILLLCAVMTSSQINKRKVLLFSTAKEPTVLQQQQKILNGEVEGLREREIVIETYLLNERNEAVFTRHTAGQAPFTFVLIGKDGGEKLRSNQLVSTKKLFGLIDQMPMRQSEMRKRQ